jgi:hypothetical protein
VASGDRTDATLQSEMERAVVSGDVNRLLGRETFLD